MSRTPTQWIGILIGVALLGAAAGYLLGGGQRAGHDPPASTDARQVLYWYDPMRPEQRFDRPGKSPYMDMQLVPRYAGPAVPDAAASATSASVQVDPGIAQSLGVRYAVAQRAPWSEDVEAVGSIVYDQRRVFVIQARAAGFVTSVHGRAPGELVARGAPLIDLHVPEWGGELTEFAALLKRDDRALVDAARARLQLAGMPAELIAQVERSGRPQPILTIAAPISGAVDTLDVRVGMAVGAGATLVKLNGLQSVWLEAEVPEARAALATAGTRIEARLAAFPGEHFAGRILAVLPEADTQTRTLRVRIEIANPGGRLRPGMYAQVRLQSAAPHALLQVPSEAVIRTGVRSLVLLAGEDGRYTPVEVRLGAEANGRTVVLAGLQEGQRIVASGQFLIDSEASLQGVLARLPAAAPDTAADPVAVNEAAPSYVAEGRVVEVADGALTVAHAAIPGLGWPAMTMPFRLLRPALAASLHPGDAIRFHLRQQGDEYVITELEPRSSPP